MNIYNTIFARKSVRGYKSEPISESMGDAIYQTYENMPKLFMGINTELQIIDCVNHNKRVAMFGVKAPYYLALYTEDKDKSIMNAGYIMEQLSLFLCSKGLGSCYVGSPVISKRFSTRGDKKLACLLAFGKPKGSCTRKITDFHRMELGQLCTFKEQPRQWMRQILEVSRLAPSSLNSQPWRFLVYDNKIHIFSKKSGRSINQKLNELNFGILFSHMMIAAEEMWLDLDLIRLENISQKNFKNCDYVLSAVLNS